MVDLICLGFRYFYNFWLLIVDQDLLNFPPDLVTALPSVHLSDTILTFPLIYCEILRRETKWKPSKKQQTVIFLCFFTRRWSQ